jgi:hypothetical protein
MSLAGMLSISNAWDPVSCSVAHSAVPTTAALSPIRMLMGGRRFTGKMGSLEVTTDVLILRAKAESKRAATR